jgi:hypothetical protein
VVTFFRHCGKDWLNEGELKECWAWVEVGFANHAKGDIIYAW